MAKKFTKNVKLVGLERKVDKLGRVVLPAEYRKQYGIHPGDKIITYPTNVGVLICKKDVRPEDIFE